MIGKPWRECGRRATETCVCVSIGEFNREERVLLRQLGKESLLMDKTNDENDLLVDYTNDDEFSLEKEEVAKLVEFK